MAIKLKHIQKPIQIYRSEQFKLHLNTLKVELLNWWFKDNLKNYPTKLWFRSKKEFVLCLYGLDKVYANSGQLCEEKTTFPFCLNYSICLFYVRKNNLTNCISI